MTKTTLRGVGLLLLLGTLTLACEGDEPTGDSSPTAARDAAPIAEASRTPEQAKGYTEQDLARALFTLQDMPTGWTTSPPEEPDTEVGFCNKRPSVADVTVEASFQKSDTGPFIGQSVQAYSPGEAEDAMRVGREDAESCPEFTETNEDGTTTTFRLSMLSFPELGDETLAVRLSAEVPLFGSLTLDMVFVRVGDLITGVAHGQLGFRGVDAEETERFVRLAVERLEDID